MGKKDQDEIWLFNWITFIDWLTVTDSLISSDFDFWFRSRTIWLFYHSVKRKTPWEDLVYKSTNFADFCPLSVPPIMGGEIPLVLTLLYGNCPLIFKHTCTFSKHSILFLRLIYRCLTFFSTSIVNCNFETFCSCKFISCVLKSEYILLIIILLLNKLPYMVSAHL